jgi:hypothetical protein
MEDLDTEMDKWPSFLKMTTIWRLAGVELLRGV